MTDTDNAQTPADKADSQVEQDPYDKAFEEIMSRSSEPKTDLHSATPATELDDLAVEQDDDTSVEDSTPDSTPAITDEQAQILSRSHLTPEMIEGWTPQQREEFFANAQKREADQASFSRSKGDEVAELKRRLEKLEGKTTEGESDEIGDTPTELGKHFHTVVNDLADTYGDEFKALGEPIQAIVKQNDQAFAKIEQQGEALTIQNRIIVDMVVSNGIRDLIPDFPSLSEEKPRADVEAKFVELWKAEDSPYRTGSEPFLQRVATSWMIPREGSREYAKKMGKRWASRRRRRARPDALRTCGP